MLRYLFSPNKNDAVVDGKLDGDSDSVEVKAGPLVVVPVDAVGHAVGGDRYTRSGRPSATGKTRMKVRWMR